MQNPLRKYRERFPLNIVQEVGRDPLRVPLDTPPELVVEMARKLAVARQTLKAVLPHPIHSLTFPETKDVSSVAENHSPTATQIVL